jgi:hypothetical protein
VGGLRKKNPQTSVSIGVSYGGRNQIPRSSVKALTNMSAPIRGLGNEGRGPAVCMRDEEPLCQQRTVKHGHVLQTE